MSQGQPGTPGNVPATQIQGLGEFSSDPKLLLRDQGRAFWEAEPTGVWLPIVRETLGHLAAGVELIGLSGRKGVGKTMQFKRLLENSIPGLDTKYDSPQHFIDDKNPKRVVVIDELGLSQRVLGKQGLVERTAPALVGRQAVVLSVGATRDLRRDVLESFMEGMQTARPGLTIHDLGDINTVSVLPEQAAAVVRARGGDKEAVQLFADHTALRQPRFFDSLLLHNGDTIVDCNKAFGAADVVQLIRGIIRPERNTHARAQQATYNIQTLRRTLDQRCHFFFTAGDFTTEQAVDMYDLAREPLPVFSEEEIKHWGFDPYQKD